MYSPAQVAAAQQEARKEQGAAEAAQQQAASANKTAEQAQSQASAVKVTQGSLQGGCKVASPCRGMSHELYYTLHRKTPLHTSCKLSLTP